MHVETAVSTLHIHCSSRLQEKFSGNNDTGDHLTVLQSQVNEVKDVMTQNIEKVLERGENLDELMVKTTDLEEHVGDNNI